MHLRLAADRRAASPLTVIAAFVLLAVLATSLVVFLVIDTDEHLVDVRVGDDGGQLYLEVTRVRGDFAWNGVDVAFVNPGGTDRAGTYLRLPEGSVQEGDRILLDPRPPAGDYRLDIRWEDKVLTQRVVTI